MLSGKNPLDTSHSTYSRMTQADRQTNRQKDRHTDRQTDGWKDGWMDRQMDRQTVDRQTCLLAHILKCTETVQGHLRLSSVTWQVGIEQSQREGNKTTWGVTIIMIIT